MADKRKREDEKRGKKGDDEEEDVEEEEEEIVEEEEEEVVEEEDGEKGGSEGEQPREPKRAKTAEGDDLPEAVLEIFSAIEDPEGWSLLGAVCENVKMDDDGNYTFSFIHTKEDESGEEISTKYNGVAQQFDDRWLIAPQKITEADLRKAYTAVYATVKEEILADQSDHEDEEEGGDPVERLHDMGIYVMYAYWPFHTDEHKLSQTAGVTVLSFANDDISDHGIWASFVPGGEDFQAYTFN